MINGRNRRLRNWKKRKTNNFPRGVDYETAPLFFMIGNKNDCIKKLAEYETAEEEGRLVVLLCKNWLDTVFGEQELFYGIDMDYIENPIREITVYNEERFTWYDGWKTVVLKGVDENGLDWEFAPEEIGKTVFLTYEEAEKALEEIEKDE